MQQPIMLDERPYHRTGADHQAQDTDEHTAASAGSSELMARANTGDQDAWEQVVERYGGLVWAVARAHGLRHADASEVSQITWLLLTQHLGLLQQPERLASWLLRTATREADRMRRPAGLLRATERSSRVRSRWRWRRWRGSPAAGRHPPRGGGACAQPADCGCRRAAHRPACSEP